MSLTNYRLKKKTKEKSTTRLLGGYKETLKLITI